MTIKEVSKLSGHSPQTIRIGLQKGIFDFGACFKTGDAKQYVYVIYPERVYELFGRGKENEEKREEKD